MREPDNSTNQTSDAINAAAVNKRPRPPGGKALFRQLQLLESAGYLHFAQEQIQASIERRAAGRGQCADSAEPGCSSRLIDSNNAGSDDLWRRAELCYPSC